MSQYKTGTVSVTNASATITGSGTLWIANLAAGNLFTKEGDNVAYTIANVDSDTVIQLTAPYSGSTSSGSIYGVTIDFTPNGLPLLSPQDLNTAAIHNEAIKNIDNSGSMTLGTAAQADLTNGTFTPSLNASYGTIITEGAGATYSASYQIFGSFVTCDFQFTFDDAGSTPVVGDRFRLLGIPAILALVGSNPREVGGLTLYNQASGNQLATYSLIIDTNAPALIYATCISVNAGVNYSNTIGGTTSWRIA